MHPSHPVNRSFQSPADSSQRAYRSPRGPGLGLNSRTSTTLRRSELRNPSTLILDLQARYDLAKAIGLRQTKIEIAALVVNLLNSVEATSLSDSFAVKNSRFGLAQGRQAPLQGELILRVRN